MANHSDSNTAENSNYGSVSSYVAGFLLSILLTVVPYYMVKNQIIESSPLLIVVLGLAVAQMLVQMLFFLHIGRGPKPLYNIVFLTGTAGMIVLVVGAGIFIMNSLYDHMSPEEVTLRLAQDENIAKISGKETGACQGNKGNHEVIVGGGTGIQPIEANRCDTLTIKSGDGVEHELRFGSPNNPVSYGGHYELPVRSDRAKIITLNEVGEFSFYDLDNPAIMGHFSVVEPGDSTPDSRQ